MRLTDVEVPGVLRRDARCAIFRNDGGIIVDERRWDIALWSKAWADSLMRRSVAILWIRFLLWYFALDLIEVNDEGVVVLYLMFFISVEWLIIRAIALFNLIEVRVVMIADDLVITIRVDEIFEVVVALIFRL